MVDNNAVKIYIRHCGERTVPILKHYFAGFNVEEINGTGKSFSEVFYINLKKIKSQKEDYALVADGDLVPVISIDKLLKQMFTPFQNDEKLISVNGSRIDKFYQKDHPVPGGFKAYKKSNIGYYIDKFDKSQLYPESYLNNEYGGTKQLWLLSPQCGHEYGQCLWHVWEKGYQRGVKDPGNNSFRKHDPDDIDNVVFIEAFGKGSSNRNKHTKSESYNRSNLPLKYKKYEKKRATDTIVLWSQLKVEIQNDVKEYHVFKLVIKILKVRFISRVIIELGAKKNQVLEKFNSY